MAPPIENNFQSAPKIVHYTEFWYSARYPGTSALDALAHPRDEVARHTRNLRVLSLFFENIFLSRSHLITHLDTGSKEIVEQTLADPAIVSLIDCGIIKTAARPGLDGVADTERTIERIRKLELGLAPDNQVTEKIVTRLPVISADSRTESRATLDLYKEIASVLRRTSNSLAKEFEELLSLAETPDSPFLHEVFAILLQATTFPEPLKTKIWQKTNSIYLAGGATFSSSSIDYYHPEYESGENVYFRGIDRRLYRPDVLLNFLNYLLNSKEVNNILKSPIGTFLSVRSDGNKNNFLWPEFLDEYFDIAKEVSEATLLKHKITGSHEPRVAELMVAAFEGQLGKYASDALGAATQIATGLAQSVDPSMGLGTRAAARGAQSLLGSGASAVMLRIKRGRTYRFLKLLKEVAVS